MKKQTNKILGYLKPVFVMCAFMLIIYGAYTPNMNAEVQHIVCVKFKKEATPEAIAQHLKAFALLKREVPEIVGYSAGKTLNSNEFDVMHYVTFRTQDGAEAFKKSPKFKAFEASNRAIWDKTLVIDAKIDK